MLRAFPCACFISAGHLRQLSCYLRYSAPKRNADGTFVVGANGCPVTQRYRPFYATKAEACADIPRIREQHEAAGSGEFIFNRRAADDYESALNRFRSALELDPYSAVAVRGMGISYAQTNKIRQALAAYTAYLELDPGAEDAEAVRDVIDIFYETR